MGGGAERAAARLAEKAVAVAAFYANTPKTVGSTRQAQRRFAFKRAKQFAAEARKKAIWSRTKATAPLAVRKPSKPGCPIGLKHAWQRKAAAREVLGAR